MRRTWLLGLGVGVWSLATVGSGLAQTYGQLALARSFLGIGEATYGVIAPTILMDLFPARQRSRVLSAFYLAMPIGGALGIGPRAAGSPSITAGTRRSSSSARPGCSRRSRPCSCPSRSAGRARGSTPSGSRSTSRPGRAAEDYIDLMVNSSYTYSVFGMAFYTFAIGGLAYWLPTFLTVDARGSSRSRRPTHPRP